MEALVVVVKSLLDRGAPRSWFALLWDSQLRRSFDLQYAGNCSASYIDLTTMIMLV